MDNRHIVPSGKLIIVMVGLPARGKSYITRKLARYLNWLQLETRIFNVGERRRATDFYQQDYRPRAITHTHSPAVTQHSADFFDPNNKDAVSLREDIALSTLHELLLWLKSKTSSVAIFDATNSTIQRRRNIVSAIEKQAGDDTEILFLESCCFDEAILEQNMRLKLQGPDYTGKDPKLALADFRARVKMYERSYEPLGRYEEQIQVPYLKLIDVGRKLVAFNTNGFLTAQAIEFLVNFHLTERQIWMTRNGESEDDCAGRIGQHSPLTVAGKRYARSMTNFVQHQQSVWERDRSGFSKQQPSKIKIWTSMMTQAMQTALNFFSAGYVIRNSPLLNDLDAGKMVGLTFEEIRSRYPLEMSEREADPVSYRWPGPGGECHSDVIHRLRAVILELERMKDHILLITHRAVMRVLLTYFEGLSRDKIATVNVPLNTLYLVQPHAYGVSVKTFRYNERSQWFDEIER